MLKDPEKRAAYDQLGPNWKAGQDFRPPPDWDAGFEFRGGGYTDADASAADHSAFFEELFGCHSADAGAAGGRRTFRMRGEDHHAKVPIDLEDSYSGATRGITLRMPELTEDGRITTRDHTLNVRILCPVAGNATAGRQRGRQNPVPTDARPTRVQSARQAGGILIRWSRAT